jgi:hypothetical protein
LADLPRSEVKERSAVDRNECATEDSGNSRRLHPLLWLRTKSLSNSRATAKGSRIEDEA